MSDVQQRSKVFVNKSQQEVCEDVERSRLS